MEQKHIQRYKMVTFFPGMGGRARSNNARITLCSKGASIDISFLQMLDCITKLATENYHKQLDKRILKNHFKNLKYSEAMLEQILFWEH